MNRGVVRPLLKNGAGVNAMGKNRRPVLHEAAHQADNQAVIAIVRLLLKKRRGGHRGGRHWIIHASADDQLFDSFYWITTGNSWWMEL